MIKVAVNIYEEQYLEYLDVFQLYFGVEKTQKLTI